MIYQKTSQSLQTEITTYKKLNDIKNTLKDCHLF